MQVFILDSLALYTPADGRESESIIERVTPRLQHANSAVVLSAVKVIIKYMDLITNQDALKALYKKMAPPLVTLLSSEPEIQYVALRNINLIVQKRPTILSHEIKVFFCKYNDPIYVSRAARAPSIASSPARHPRPRHAISRHLRAGEDGEARNHDQARVRPKCRPGADGAQRVLHRGFFSRPLCSPLSRSPPSSSSLPTPPSAPTHTHPPPTPPSFHRQADRPAITHRSTSNSSGGRFAPLGAAPSNSSELPNAASTCCLS